jgi:hypothetical protein
MRTTKELREGLAMSADDSGRSLAQEVEARLDRSFYLDASMMLTHGPDANLIYALSTAVAMCAMLELEERPRALQVASFHIIAAMFEIDIKNNQARSVEWLVSTPFAMKGVEIAGRVLRNIGAPGPIAHFEKITTELLAMVAKKNAAELLRDPADEPGFDDWAERTHKEVLASAAQESKRGEKAKRKDKADD